MTRPADPSLYLDDELDITPMAEGKFVVEARKVCDAPWAAVLATYLGNLGMAVEVRAEEEGASEDGRYG